MVTTDNVLLDIGGVLTVDPWQTIMLTPGLGLVDRLDLDRDLVRAQAEALWDFYSRNEADEAGYWRQLADRIGATIPPPVLSEVEGELLRPYPGAAPLLRSLEAAGVPWGFVTNNTSFWYAKQLAMLGVAPSAPRWALTSFGTGRAKEDAGDGLFELAATVVDPARTLVIDDREDNVLRARQVGFHARRYTPGAGVALAEVVATVGGYA